MYSHQLNVCFHKNPLSVRLQGSFLGAKGEQIEFSCSLLPSDSYMTGPLDFKDLPISEIKSNWPPSEGEPLVLWI